MPDQPAAVRQQLRDLAYDAVSRTADIEYVDDRQHVADEVVGAIWPVITEGRRLVAEEIIRKIEAESPSTGRFWDLGDSARVSAYGSAIRIAREVGATDATAPSGSAPTRAQDGTEPDHQVLIDVLEIAPDGTTHTYWCTYCRHAIALSRPELHDRCKATELAPGMPRRPAQCKTCAAPCICPCHKSSSGEAAA